MKIQCEETTTDDELLKWMLKQPQCPTPVLGVSDCALATGRLVPGAKSAPDPEKGQLQPEGQAVTAEEL